MIQHKRKDKVYSIHLVGVKPRPGSDKTIYQYRVENNLAEWSFDLFIHFPNTLILRNRLPASSLEQISGKKVIEWLDQGIEETANIYVLPEDVPSEPYLPAGISPS